MSLLKELSRWGESWTIRALRLQPRFHRDLNFPASRRPGNDQCRFGPHVRLVARGHRVAVALSPNEGHAPRRPHAACPADLREWPPACSAGPGPLDSGPPACRDRNCRSFRPARSSRRPCGAVPRSAGLRDCSGHSLRQDNGDRFFRDLVSIGILWTLEATGLVDPSGTVQAVIKTLSLPHWDWHNRNMRTIPAVILFLVGMRVAGSLGA